MAATDSSGSMTSPVPEMMSVCSSSMVSNKASSLLRILSVLQSLASSTAALVRFPLNFSSFPSSLSNRLNASAAAPANPTRTLSLYMKRTLLALCFITVSPILTWPSPAITDLPSFLTARTVVALTLFEALSFETLLFKTLSCMLWLSLFMILLFVPFTHYQPH